MERWRTVAIPNNRQAGIGLGIAALTYVGIDYLHFISPTWHARLQPVLWIVLAISSIVRIPFYKHWSVELRSALPFVLALVFMVSALILEAISVRSITAVLGLDWHKNTPPLPDIGQWLLLALNEKLPQPIIEILRAPVIKLHHFLMLFVMLAFSVLFGSVKAPGLGLGARYMFTMGIGRLLRTIVFISTVLPSPRPWCAKARFPVPNFPHPWAQKYYTPYSIDPYSIRQVIHYDIAFVNTEVFKAEYRPDWGGMSFLINFMRPTVQDGSNPWYHLLKKASGGCNDLMYSGHMLVATLTAMAWTEAYGGYSSVVIWMLVLHTGQREIRERNHYSVDCVVAIYMGILLWKMTGLFWPLKDGLKQKRLEKLEKIQGRLVQAAKDSDMNEVRELLKEVELSSRVRENGMSKGMWLFSGATVLGTLTMVFLFFTIFSDG